MSEKKEMTERKSNQPLKLTKRGYWKEIEILMDKMLLPTEVGILLEGVINTHINSVIPPAVKASQIELAKEYLEGGILLTGDDRIERLFEVGVFVPDPGKEDKLKSFFLLLPKWNEGEVKYLRDL